MIAYSKFKDIEKLPSVVDKHKVWLEDYKGKRFSKGINGKDLIQWKQTKYEKFESDINKVGELGNRLRIEFDGEPTKAKEYLEEVYNKLKENGWGFIRSTHQGKCDYLWIEFTKDLKTKEKKDFLTWICPSNAEIDLNFSSQSFCFPVLYAIHWKHSSYREMPIEYFEGEQINFDSLNIPSSKGEKIIEKKGDSIYFTFKKAATIFTKQGQVEAFSKIQPLFYDRAGIWWLWNESMKKWEVVDDVDILNMVAQTTGEDTINSKNRNEILNALKQEGRKNIPKPIKNTWIQFKNKIYDTLNGESFPASSEFFVTNPIPWEISGDPNTPTIDKIFTDWVGEKDKTTLYEMLAYCILPDYPIHRIFCLIGSGLNGKGSFLNLLERFIGKENICSTELDTLIASRFEITRLHKKLVCVMGETNFAELSKTSMLKKLSGGDMIGFEYKNKNPFEDHNYAKIVIATNNLPATTDKTIGFYRRWLIQDFPNRFDEKKDILSDIPQEEYNNLATNSFILLTQLLKKREFTHEGTIEERMERYESRSNFLEKFIETFISEDSEGYITKSEFYKKFIEWSRENRHREMSETSVGLKMKQLGHESSTKHFNWMNDGRGGNARIWASIRWKE